MRNFKMCPLATNLFFVPLFIAWLINKIRGRTVEGEKRNNLLAKVEKCEGE